MLMGRVRARTGCIAGRKKLPAVVATEETAGETPDAAPAPAAADAAAGAPAVAAAPTGSAESPALPAGWTTQVSSSTGDTCAAAPLQQSSGSSWVSCARGVLYLAFGNLASFIVLANSGASQVLVQRRNRRVDIRPADGSRCSCRWGSAGRLVGAGVLVDRRHVSWPFHRHPANAISQRHFPTPLPNATSQRHFPTPFHRHPSQRSAGSPTRDNYTPRPPSSAPPATAGILELTRGGCDSLTLIDLPNRTPAPYSGPNTTPDTAARSFGSRVRPRSHVDARACHICTPAGTGSTKPPGIRPTTGRNDRAISTRLCFCTLVRRPSTWQIWTTLQHDCPDHLGLWLNRCRWNIGIAALGGGVRSRPGFGARIGGRGRGGVVGVGVGSSKKPLLCSHRLPPPPTEAVPTPLAWRVFWIHLSA